MIKNVTLVDFGDVLTTASNIGYDWNQAHDILVKDEITPMYESKTRSYDISDFSKSNPYGLSEDTLKIMNRFCEDNSLTSFTLE